MIAHHASTPVRVGVFRRIAAADRAVAELVEAGFDDGSITVICPTCSDEVLEPYRAPPSGAHTAEAAAAGGTIGAVLGGLSATVGLVATGGTGLLVAGPLLGAAATGAVTGGFLGAMATRGIEPEIADYYDQALRKGRILVAVDTSKGEAPPAPEVAEKALERAGAEPIALPKG
jgi:hypothetical protein